MNSTGFDWSGGVAAFPGTRKFCAIFGGLGDKSVRLLLRLGMAVGPIALALTLVAASAFVLPTSAQAQTITCTGGPVTNSSVRVTYSVVSNTCVLVNDGIISSEAGALTFVVRKVPTLVVGGNRGTGGGQQGSGFNKCDLGAGAGDVGAGNCSQSGMADDTDFTATLEWDSTNPNAPVVADRRAVVTYRGNSAGVTVTIQSATITVLGPEISVSGNGVDIPNGDTTPSTADDTDFGAVANGSSVAKTFTIFNRVVVGAPALELGANAVTITGSSDFAVTTQPAATITTGPADPGTTTTVITFTPSSAGAKTATVTINNNDVDESPFTFTIQGNADGSSSSSDIATAQQICDFLGSRNILVLGNQPDPGRRIDRLSGAGGGDEGSASVSALGFAASVPSPVDFSIVNGRLSYAASASEAAAFMDARPGGATLPDIGEWDIWTEGKFDLFTDNVSQSGTFGIAHFGAETLVSEEILLGLRLQVDWMRQNFAATSGRVTSLGGMVGPYATIALTDGLFLDLTGAWGMSGSDITPFGTYTDRFYSSRMMLAASLAGLVEFDNWTIRPVLSGQFISDTQLAYVSGSGSVIGAQTVSQGEISFAPRIAYGFDLEDGATLSPWVEGTGRYLIQTAGAPAAGSFSAIMAGVTGAVGAGVDLTLPSGLSIAISGDYGGIGASAESYGGGLALSAPIR